MSTPIVVIDNGSCFLRSGYSNFNLVSSTPTRATKSKYPTNASRASNYFATFLPPPKWGMALDIHCPVSGGHITNIHAMERLWLDTMDLYPADRGVIVSEASICASQAKREKMAQIFFEQIRVPLFSVQNASYLALVAHGKQTGVVLDMGYHSTRICPFDNGQHLRYASANVPFGASILETTISGQTLLSCDNVRYVMPQLMLQSWMLPDGTEFQASQDSQHVFQTTVEQGCANIAVELFNCLYKNPMHIRKYLLQNGLVLAGGMSASKWFEPIFVQSIKKKHVPDTQIATFGERHIATWTGGCILGSLSTFEEIFATSKAEYEEIGVRAVHNKATPVLDYPTPMFSAPVDRLLSSASSVVVESL